MVLNPILEMVAHCGFESHPVYTWQGSSPPSVPHMMRSGVISVGERTLSYRENDWESKLY
jgi:hypothetical protein